MEQFTLDEKRRFWILVIIVSISGFSQGMLLPLISVIFEQDGVSSALNGLNATGLYIGTLLISPFIEYPLRRFGYKPIIIVGGALVFSSLLLFPLWKTVWFWFFLRLLIGIGDHMLHFSTQTWITSTSPSHRLGKSIAIYGLSFSVGFAAGPLFVPLVKFFEALPFIISAVLCLWAWLLVFFLRNEFPENTQSAAQVGSLKRYVDTLKYAWVAFLPPFCYGFLESSLNALFPVYALRKSFDVSMLSFILASFTVGGIVSQVPLGMLGDRIGRKKVIILAFSGGGLLFGLGSLLESSEIALAAAFVTAGLFAGSVFSLGITYMTDLTPKQLLPTGNLLCGIFFSFGSLTGPFLGGLYLQYIQNYSFLLLISGVMLTLLLLFIVGGKTLKKAI